MCALIFIPSAAATDTKNTPRRDLIKSYHRAVSKILHAQHLISSCRSAEKAIVFYRSKVWNYQGVLGEKKLSTNYPERRVGACAYKKFVVTSWRGMAREYSRQYKRYLKEQSHPEWIALRLLHNNRTEWECLKYIVSMENRTWDPTLDYGGGHGNVYEAYGIPQATPGYKMASAGPDWRTNPETQIRWMIGYTRARFGSVCGAAYSRRVNGTY